MPAASLSPGCAITHLNVLCPAADFFHTAIHTKLAWVNIGCDSSTATAGLVLSHLRSCAFCGVAKVLPHPCCMSLGCNLQRLWVSGIYAATSREARAPCSSRTLSVRLLQQLFAELDLTESVGAGGDLHHLHSLLLFLLCSVVPHHQVGILNCRADSHVICLQQAIKL